MQGTYCMLRNLETFPPLPMAPHRGGCAFWVRGLMEMSKKKRYHTQPGRDGIKSSEEVPFHSGTAGLFLPGSLSLPAWPPPAPSLACELCTGGAEMHCLYCSSPCSVGMSSIHDLVLSQALVMDHKVVSSYFALVSNAAMNIFGKILAGISIR